MCHDPMWTHQSCSEYLNETLGHTFPTMHLDRPCGRATLPVIMVSCSRNLVKWPFSQRPIRNLHGAKCSPKCKITHEGSLTEDSGSSGRAEVDFLIWFHVPHGGLLFLLWTLSECFCFHLWRTLILLFPSTWLGLISWMIHIFVQLQTDGVKQSDRDYQTLTFYFWLNVSCQSLTQAQMLSRTQGFPGLESLVLDFQTVM